MIAALIVIIAAAVPLPGRGGAGWPDAWVIIGIILAATAVGGTIWNGWQLYRHVSLAKRDVDGRLRPVLAWTSDGSGKGHPFTVLGGDMIRVRITNAGQATAVRIEYRVRSGMEADFGEGRVARDRGQRGALAPNGIMEICVRLTDEQERRTQGGETFRFEIDAEYRSPTGDSHTYSMGGDYDGNETVLHG